jgi:hypothetical protein
MPRSVSRLPTRYQASALTTKKREVDDILALYLGQYARGECKGFQEASLSMKKVFDNFDKDCHRRAHAVATIWLHHT